jgi:hypothetical protein
MILLSSCCLFQITFKFLYKMLDYSEMKFFVKICIFSRWLANMTNFLHDNVIIPIKMGSDVYISFSNHYI